VVDVPREFLPVRAIVVDVPREFLPVRAIVVDVPRDTHNMCTLFLALIVSCAYLRDFKIIIIFFMIYI
jgi:putative transposon-encoded protein